MLILLAPELSCLVVMLVLFVCVIMRVRYRTSWRFAVLGGAIMVLLSILTLNEEGDLFGQGIFKVDFFSQFFKLLLSAGFLFLILISGKVRTMRRSAWLEFPLFILFSTLGMMLVVSATELLTIYVALELSAYPLYILVALNKNRLLGAENATKYMIQGMVASAFSLYGISFIFGVAGSTVLKDIAVNLDQLVPQPIFWLGLLMTFASLFFKLAVFPFHFWAPDIYQAASHRVITFIATSSKIAAVGMFCRLSALLVGEDRLSIGSEAFEVFMLVMAVIAMTVGNLIALRQTNLKRLLGYSAVAHAGYILIGIQVFTELGLTASIYYLVAYFLMSALVFLVVCRVAIDEESPDIEILAGLHKRSPFLALCLLIGVFGLTGLPPTAGFTGKWFLFSAAIEQKQYLLVFVAAVNSAIAVYYYLHLVRVAYLDEPINSDPLRTRLRIRVTAGVLLILLIVVGTMPGFVWDLAQRATTALIASMN